MKTLTITLPTTVFSSLGLALDGLAVERGGESPGVEGRICATARARGTRATVASAE